MKKLLKVFIIICIFLITKVVSAEEFIEGDYITGAYINKVKDGVTHYMTMQYIRDSNGNVVYCLEPFIKFEEGKSYTMYEGDLTGYKELSDEQKKRISVIIYFGYGYTGRTTSSWYVATQYLVWKTVDPDANIYFTDKLNGKKVEKYTNEMETIMKSVEYNAKVPEWAKTYYVNYGDDLTIKGMTNYGLEECKYNFAFGGSLQLFNVTKSGVITARAKAFEYTGIKPTIYDSTDSQDLIKPGKITNPLRYINIVVNFPSLTLDIRKDDSVYTVESDFSDTCYEISKSNKVIDKVCTGSDNLIYKIDDLELGTYKVKQVSVGTGYVLDSNEYEVELKKGEISPTLILYNKLIKNDIEIKKFACVDDYCDFERDALFEIRDKNDYLVDTISTDKDGYGKVTLGYGSYLVRQVKGLNDYSIVEDYTERILDQETKHYRELYNLYLKDDEKDEETIQLSVVKPVTNVDGCKVPKSIMKIISISCGLIFAFFKIV